MEDIYVPFLSRGVPYLELDRRVVQTDGLCEEGGADRALLVLVELALDETQHKTRLADGALAQQYQLELANLALGRTVRSLRLASSVCHFLLLQPNKITSVPNLLRV